ncbi:MAG: superoxide dismutase [Bacteroidota bacterium]
MDKRTFLKVNLQLAGAAVLAPLAACTSQDTPITIPAITAGAEGFTLPELGYAHDALQAAIDTETMQIHHGKHHAGYVRKLNTALEGMDLTGKTLNGMLATLGEGDTAIRNNGGGHYNHSLFWSILTPQTGMQPNDKLGGAIAETFGSLEDFKTLFLNTAKTRFGSGWGWLSVGADGKLFVSSTPNQDNPLMTNLVEQNGTPILGVDVWEHAYYLRYQNLRGDYLSNFWNIINWEEVGKRYLAAVAKVG